MIVDGLAAQRMDDVLVTVDGTIPADDVLKLKTFGVAEVFTPGATTQSMVDFLEGAVRGRTREAESDVQHL